MRPTRSSGLPSSAIASLLAGLGALGFLTVGRVTVGLAGFAPVANMWTVWSISAATVTFGAQIETVARLAQGGGPFSVRHLRMASTAAAVVATVTFSARGSLFQSSGLFWPVLCTLVPFGSLATGVARGLLASKGRHGRLATIVAGENVIRFGIAGAAWWLAATNRSLAWALLGGFSVALIGLTESDGAERVKLPSKRLGGNVGALAGLVAHACLVLPPSVLALRGAAPEIVSAVFLVLTYMRAPYQFLLGMGPILTAWSFNPSENATTRWFIDRTRLAGSAAFLMVAAAATGFATGNLLSRLIIGRTDVVGRLDYAILAALVVGVAVSILRTLQVLGQHQHRPAAEAWLSTAAIAIASGIVFKDPTSLFAALLAAVSLGLVRLLWVGEAPSSSRRVRDR